MHIQIGQVVTQIISFLIMYFLLKRYAWKPFFTVLDERNYKIRNEFETIEQQKKQFEALQEEFHNHLKKSDIDMRNKVMEAIKEGQEIAKEIKNEAQQQAKEIIKKAHTEMEQELVKLKAQLKDDIVQMTIAASEKLIQANLNDKKQKELVETFIDRGCP